MWRVIAADDEAYIREALEKLINWEKMECELLAVVKDGQELLRSIDKLSPDIVITDIQMPVVSGLEVCCYLYETKPEIQAILLTAYSDFDYAKTAVKYSVCDYVLKLSIIEELPEAIKKAVGILVKLKRELEENVDAGGEQETLIERIDKYISENFRRKISLDDIADEFHVNRSYLSRFYKHKRGVNLFDHILQLRIDLAKNYLTHSDMRTYEIAEAVGIEDAGYFSKIFKRNTGLTPKEYRKQGDNEET